MMLRLVVCLSMTRQIFPLIVANADWEDDGEDETWYVEVVYGCLVVVHL